MWGKATTLTHDVTITEPGSNNAPTAVIASGTCTTFTTCAMSATGSSDPDTAGGDGVRTYLWTWGDGSTTTGTAASQSHVYNVAGTYNVTLQVQDKWGRTSTNTASQSVTTLAEPAGNAAPTVVFNQPTCTGATCAVSSTGSADSDGGIRSYTWKWGDGSVDTVTTSTSSSHTFAASGGYTITLVVTDNWGKTASLTRTVTIP